MECDIIMDSSKDLKKGAGTDHEDEDGHGAKDALEVPVGPMTRSRTKQFTKAIGVLLQKVMTQDDHLNYGGCVKATLVMIHAQGYVIYLHSFFFVFGFFL